jgi:putative transposase
VHAPHVQHRADPLLSGSLPEGMIREKNLRWAKFVSAPTDEEDLELLRRHQRTGRPLGAKRFITKIERVVVRNLRPQKPGRPRTSGK